MKLSLSLLAVCLPFALQAQNTTWTSAGAPVIANISGGPWTLAQGGPYVQTDGSTTSGGPVSGTTPYCSNGTPIVNSPSSVNPMQPFYFPFVSGRGTTLQGYFDYRPRNVNEAVVAAVSSNGGQTWSFENQIENLNNICPATDKNGSGNDDGLGHPYVVSFGGAGWLYMLDRRNGHVDFDGLVEHMLTPKAGSPLNGLPANSEYGPPTSNIITQWNFELTGGTNTHPTPNIGSGTATPLGMTNNYAGPTPGCASTNSCEYTGSTNKDDITGETGGTNPSLDAKAWRIRGAGGLSGGSTGNGWNTQAPQFTQGAEFQVSTVGFANIIVQFDWYTTAQAVRNLQAQYSIDSANSTWTSIGPIYTAPAGGAFYPQITLDFTNIAGVGNNAHFAVRFVSVYDPSPNAPPNTYTAATLSATGQPVQINNTSGNWQFDEVNVLGTAIGAARIQLPVKTSGLTNPDGILAAVQNTYPLAILYVDKTLNGDYAFPAAQQCSTAAGWPSSPNHDTESIHYATSNDGVNWTDRGAVNGLNDPTTVSAHGIRYMAPSGSLLKLANGKWGLFFGGGNCLDGDSDGFHAIMYAESADLMNWTVINGIDNPIASVDSVTDPNNSSVTIPANTPVIGATQAWFGGRVYNPNGMWASPNSVNLIFAGYDAAYSADISSYRTIGHVTLTTNAVLQ